MEGNKGGGDYILEVQGLSKSFGGTKALQDVELHIKKGEVHALVGENGAGKSTLMKSIIGLHKFDSGTITFEGKPYKVNGPAEAIKRGITMIHQELNPEPHLTVAENIFLHNEDTKGIFLKKDATNKRAEKILKEFDFDISPTHLVGDLTLAQAQMIEIMKAVSCDAKLVIMDEPTSSLDNEETERLFRTIRQLKEKGVSVVYISHRMDEVFQISDRITVFRDGQYIATRNIGEVTYDDVIRLMVGREMKDVYPEVNLTKGKELLRVEHLDDGKFLKDISFELHQGEILGFYGLVGSGRTEIMRYLFGVDKGAAYNAWLEGREFKVSNPKEAIEAGIILAPESRKEQGLVLIQDIRFNTVLAILDKLIHGVKTDKKQETEIVEKYMKKMRTKATSAAHITGQLSGGNQQKVVLAKCLATNPKILILDEPTRGIDVGAKFEIYKMITELAEEGVGIIFISSELPEILNLSTRVITMHEGQKTGELAREELSEELVLKYATGGANK